MGHRLHEVGWPGLPQACALHHFFTSVQPDQIFVFKVYPVHQPGVTR
jgi:hypothetical protein